MHNAIAGDEVVPLGKRDEGFYLVVSDLVSLIDRVQASIKLIETARTRQDTAEAELADIVVLDDVTPLYAQASVALAACNASLRATLQFLIEGTATAPQA